MQEDFHMILVLGFLTRPLFSVKYGFLEKKIKPRSFLTQG